MDNTLPESKDFWEQIAQEDPFWGIFPRSQKGTWQDRIDYFYETGMIQVRNMLRPLNRHLKNGVAVDFGCGVGRTTRPLSRYFNQVIGYDSSPTMIETAKKYTTEENVSYKCGSVEDIPKDYVDFLLSVVTLQHIPKHWTLPTLHSLLRTLAIGGLAVFQVPDCETDKDTETPLKNFNIVSTPISSVVSCIQSSGCFVIRIDKDLMLGQHWHNYTYYIGKGRGYTVSIPNHWES